MVLEVSEASTWSSVSSFDPLRGESMIIQHSCFNEIVNEKYQRES
jgi:hypothetical protein